MPAAAYIGLLGFLFAHLGDQWRFFGGFEEFIHHDFAEAVGEAQMLFWRQFLVAEKQQAMFSEGLRAAALAECRSWWPVAGR